MSRIVRTIVTAAIALQGTVIFMPNPGPGVDFGPIVVIQVPAPPTPHAAKKPEPPKTVKEKK